MMSKLNYCRNLVLLIVAIIAFAACGNDSGDGQINSEESDVGSEDSGPIDCFEYLPPCPAECVPVQARPWDEVEECLEWSNMEDALCNTSPHIGMGQEEMYVRRPDGRIFWFSVSVENLFPYGWERVPFSEIIDVDEYPYCD